MTTHTTGSSSISTSDKDRKTLKIAFWIIVVAVAGTLLCIILGILKFAIQSVLIAGGILLIVALIFAVVYEKARNRILLNRVDREDS